MVLIVKVELCNGSSQDAFRDAILQRGPIETFALKTVQEFIQPQVTQQSKISLFSVSVTSILRSLVHIYVYMESHYSY